MTRLEPIIQALSDQQLEQAFREILRGKETGELPKVGILRSCHRNYEQTLSTNIPIEVTKEEILLEIAKRAYSKHYVIVLHNLENGQERLETITSKTKPTDQFIEQCRSFYKAERVTVEER